MYEEIVRFIKSIYSSETFVPLHAPLFVGNEKKYLNDCIDSTYVSSVGQYVNRFEEMICSYTSAKFAVATSNGTSALHMALMVVGVERDTEVLTQALTFVATANAISYIGAQPVFLDSAKNNLGMCPIDLEQFLEENVALDDLRRPINKNTRRRIAACVPMHVFGNPVEIDEIKAICDRFCIPVVEDAAEALGSFYKGGHTGLTGDIGVLSFNGNKIVTCGGGGMILTNDELLAHRAKHLTTTAKRSHPWEFFHDEVGYNYRLPNLNASLGCAQMENLDVFISNKRETASRYQSFFTQLGIKFLEENRNSRSNCWLNGVELESRTMRDEFLEYSNHHGVMVRPVWHLMTELPQFERFEKSVLRNAERYRETVVNLPSSVRRLLT